MATTASEGQNQNDVVTAPTQNTDADGHGEAEKPQPQSHAHPHKLHKPHHDREAPAANHSASTEPAKEAVKPGAKPGAGAAAGGGGGFLSHIPPWITTNVKNPKTWKVLFRCVLASWIGLVVMITGPGLRTLGNT
jgi:hypothetical protein